MSTWRSVYLGGGAFVIAYVPQVVRRRKRPAKRRATRRNHR